MTNPTVLLEALDRVGTPLCTKAADRIRILEKALRMFGDESNWSPGDTWSASARPWRLAQRYLEMGEP
jgi:hypothetical protein